MAISDVDAIVDRTEDVTPAFLRELVRKAALYGLRAGESPIADRHFDEALAQLEQGGRLTRRLLGADPAEGPKLADEPWDDDGWEDDE